MAITVGTFYSAELALGTNAATAWTITGIAVPADATACILLTMGYTGTTSGRLDISNFDADAHDHFTLIAEAKDQISGGNYNVDAHYLKYGETGFPERGASGLTFTGSFAQITQFGKTKVVVFFLSGTVTDATFIIGTSTLNGTTGSNWSCDDLGSVDAADIGFIAACNYGSNIESTPAGAGQTQIAEGNTGDGTSAWGASYEVGEDVLTVEVSKNYFGGVAFAVLAAAGGASSTPPDDRGIMRGEMRGINRGMSRIN
jgi:hypothetical protein